jgi:hypothetical protein
MSIITDDVGDYLSNARIPIRLACNTAEGWPIVISLWYLYEGGELYCATQESARVVSYLRENPQCGFEVAADTPPYCGVRGQGIARLDTDLGLDVLKRLLTRYLGSTDSPLARKLLNRQTAEVALIIKPVRVFTWNFSNRMKGSVDQTADEKPCPD